MTSYAHLVEDLNVTPLAEEQIVTAASNLRHYYQEVCGIATDTALCPENVIWDYLDSPVFEKADRVSLETEAALGHDENGVRIAGKMTMLECGGIIRIDAATVTMPLYPFTVAHEIGHWILHRACLREYLKTRMTAEIELVTLQRDLEGKPSQALFRIEQQANRFAVHFLMPEKAVRMAFRKCFGSRTFSYSEFCRTSADASLYKSKHDYAKFLITRGLSPCLKPLNKQFKVSIETMAIRVQELGLVAN